MSTGLLALLLTLLPSLAGANALDHLITTDDIGENKVPHLGTSSVLVIPMWVGGPFPPDLLRVMRTYYRPEGGPGTFRGFWQAMSGGRYDPIPVLVEPLVYDECPIPGRELANCTVQVTDTALLGAVRSLFGGAFARLRDEQDIDLSMFDINTADGPGQDGFFDGIVIRTNILGGVALPLNALRQRVDVPLAKGAPVPDRDTPPAGEFISFGNVAMVPPDNHEFGHILGFVDLYNGPTINDMMSDKEDTGLSAFSRLQIEWGEATPVDGPGVWTLDPVMDGGTILQFGEEAQRVLIEFRAGESHEVWDASPPGIYVYAVDTTAIKDGPLGFLDLLAGDLYFPNRAAPYLNVNLPVGCAWLSAGEACAVRRPGERRALSHPDGKVAAGLVLQLDEYTDEGGVKITIFHEDNPPPRPIPVDSALPSPSEDAGLGADGGESAGSGGGGCSQGGSPGSGGLLLLGFLALIGVSRRRRPFEGLR